MWKGPESNILFNPEFMNEVKDACLKKQAFCFEAPDGFLVLRAVLSDDGIP